MVLALLASACSSEEVAQPAPSKSAVLAEWLGMTDAPSAREGAASAVADGLLYVAGGVGANGLLKTVVHYDPAVNAWTEVPDLPIALRDAAAVGRGAEVVVIGGFTDLEGKVPSGRVFSLKGAEWVELEPLGVARGALGAAYVRGKVYAIGGVVANGRATAKVEILEDKVWTAGSSLLTARSHMGVTGGDRFIYALGGRTGTGSLPIERARREVERFDSASDTWQKRTPLIVGRSSLGAVSGGSSVLAIGGNSPKGDVLSTVETYGVVGNTWSEYQPAMPNPLRSMAAGVIDGKIVLAMGATGAAGTVTAQTWSLSVALTPLIP